jgi:hypothetical protein
MPNQKPKPAPVLQQPGPGRATSEIAFNELRKDVARRNEEAHLASVKRRAESERKKIIARRSPAEHAQPLGQRTGDRRHRRGERHGPRDRASARR